MPPLRAVLFDLDGTLLGNDMDVFLPHYFESISARVAALVPPKMFLAQLMSSTRDMMANDGTMTNQERFAASFFPSVGRPREELEPVFDAFYREDFPSLRAYTTCRPESRPVVEATMALGLDAVIATNPLFPATAIRQRMEWAGLGDLPFRLVTSYENSRACKPNPLYFRLVAEELGCEPDQCLMVGNEAFDLAAARAGLPVYLVSDGTPGTFPPDAPAPAYTGPLAALPDLLRSLL